jgi:hypothetical protein
MPSAASRAAQLRQQQQEGSENQDKEGEEGAVKGKELGTPPPTLVEHPPLAVYANGLLAALNELRHCAPFPIREPAASALQNSLVRAAAALAHVQAVRTLNETEQPVFKAACLALTTALCPYISACFDRVFPGSTALLDLQAVAAELSQAQE